MRRVVVSFEGLDGSGKTTQVRLLHTYLREAGIPVEVLKQPPIDGISPELEKTLLDRCLIDVANDDEKHLLYMAQALTTEDCYSGEGVLILDRAQHSMIAYADAMSFKLPMLMSELTYKLAKWITWPDVTFFLNMSAAEACNRRGQQVDRYETLELQELVCHGYHDCLWQGNVVQLDGTCSIEDIQQQIRKSLDPMLEAIPLSLGVEAGPGSQLLMF